MSVRPHPTKSKKEPGKWWYIDLWNKGNRQRIPFQGSYEEAVETERSLRQAPDPKGLVAPKISEMVVPFLDYYQGEAAASTVKDARWVIEGHILPFFGKFQPRQVEGLIDRYKQAKLDSGLKHRTINKHLSVLSSIIKWGVDQKLCQPVEIKLFPSKKTRPAPARPLTTKQIDTLYKHIQPQYRLLFLLMADMGLRRSEAMNMPADNIDEHRKTVTVKGKGSKYRIIPFTTERIEKEIIAALEEHPSGLLCPNPSTGKAYYSIRKELARAAKKADLGRKVDHHTLRHSFLSNAAMKGISPHALQQLAGHSSIETTNKIYTHVREDFVRSEVKKLR